MKRIITLTALVVFVAGGTTLGWRRFSTASVPAGTERVVHMTAKKFEYDPSEITLKKGVPVILEITALDRDHGFKIPGLGIRADLKSGQVTRIAIVPDRTGPSSFDVTCSVASGYEDMMGELVVVD